MSTSEKTRGRTMSGVKGRVPGAVLNEEEIVIPGGVVFPLNLGPLGSRPASPSDSERGPYLLKTSLLSLSFSPIIIVIPLSRSARRDLARVWRSLMLRPGRHRSVSLVCPHQPRTLVPNSKPWIALLTMSITGHRRCQQEYGYLSYLYYAVLGLDEVDRLAHTVTEEVGTRGLTVSLLFLPFIPSVLTRPKFVTSSKHSSVLVCRFLCRTLGAHSTSSPALLCPQNLPRA
jgi:hypothetical protein